MKFFFCSISEAFLKEKMLTFVVYLFVSTTGLDRSRLFSLLSTKFFDFLRYISNLIHVPPLYFYLPRLRVSLTLFSSNPFGILLESILTIYSIHLSLLPEILYLIYFPSNHFKFCIYILLPSVIFLSISLPHIFSPSMFLWYSHFKTERHRFYPRILSCSTHSLISTTHSSSFLSCWKERGHTAQFVPKKISRISMKKSRLWTTCFLSKVVIFSWM